MNRLHIKLHNYEPRALCKAAVIFISWRKLGNVVYFTDAFESGGLITPAKVLFWLYVRRAALTLTSVRAEVSLFVLTRTKGCITALIAEVKGKIAPALLIITVLIIYWVKLISEIILAEAVQPTIGINLIH